MEQMVKREMDATVKTSFAPDGIVLYVRNACQLRNSDRGEWARVLEPWDTMKRRLADGHDSGTGMHSRGTDYGPSRHFGTMRKFVAIAG